MVRLIFARAMKENNLIYQNPKKKIKSSVCTKAMMLNMSAAKKDEIEEKIDQILIIAIPVYCMNVFLLPKKSNQDINMLFRIFSWSSHAKDTGVHWIGWD